MTTHKKAQPKFALALSGGAARCIAHLGVIQVLEEEGIEVDAIAGTSGGSLVGALYLDGRMAVDELIKLAARTGWGSLFTPVIPKLGLISSAGIHRFIKDHLHSRYIGDLKKPFAAVCSDLVTGEKVVLTKGPLALAVQASCSLPVIFTPTEVDGRMLIDGGYVSQIPVLAAREDLGAKVVAAVDVNYKSSNEPKLGNVLGVAMHLTQMFARRNAVTELPHADVVISVDIEGIQLYDMQKHEELVERGRRACKAKIAEIRRRLEAM
jgi:NTE family protein